MSRLIYALWSRRGDAVGDGSGLRPAVLGESKPSISRASVPAHPVESLGAYEAWFFRVGDAADRGLCVVRIG